MLSRKTVVGVTLTLIAIAAVSYWAQQRLPAQKPGFTPPDSQTRSRAVGSLHRETRELKRAFAPSDQFFDPIPKPGPSDWLAQHGETGQTFQQFSMGQPNRPDRFRNKLYLQPLGDFSGDDCPDLDALKEFAQSFFEMDVVFLKAHDLESLPVKTRDRSSGHRQILTLDVLDWLSNRIPDDAYCMLAITMQDLYPDEDWNYVFGQASLRERVGVYSFARYSPAFFGEPKNDDTESLILLRSCKVLAHETGHMFGIKHCVHFHCLMNGANNQDESDSQPLHLCPVCLRKLHSSVKFEVSKRYKNLLNRSEAAGWKDESVWLQKRIKYIESP